MVVFICKSSSNILKFRNYRWSLQTIWKTKSLQTRYFWQVKAICEFLTQLGIHSEYWRKSDIWVIEIKFARKVFRKRFCLIRCRRQLLMAARIAYLSFLRALLAVLLACFFFWTRENNFLIKKCLSFWWFFLLLSYVPKSTYLNSF